MATNYKNLGLSAKLTFQEKIPQILNGFGDSPIIFSILIIILFTTTSFLVFKLVLKNKEYAPISILILMVATCGLIIEIIFMTDRIWNWRYWIFYYLTPCCLSVVVVTNAKNFKSKIIVYCFLLLVSINIFYKWPWLNVQETQKQLDAQIQMADYIESLGDDCVIYGYGWFDNPCIAFYHNHTYYQLQRDRHLKVKPDASHRYYLVEAGMQTSDEVFKLYKTKLHKNIGGNKLYKIISEK